MLKDVIFLRVLASLAVVFVHSYAMYYSWDIPGIEHIDMKIIDIIRQTGFRMPIFFFISGFLFSLKMFKTNGNYSFKDLFLSKVTRLVLPAFIFSALMILTIPTLEWNNIALGSGHLWFLMTMFYCFILTYPIVKIRKTSWQILAFLSMTMLLVIIDIVAGKYVSSVVNIPAIFISQIWFYLGYLVFRYKDILITKLAKTLPLIILSISIVLAFLFTQYIDSLENNIITKILSVGITRVYYGLWLMFLWLFINYLIGKFDLTPGKAINSFAKYSFGVYILHQWFALLILQNSSSEMLAFINGYPAIAPLILFVIILLSSYTITWGLCKTKVGRFLFL